jgi:hypothetical protein
VVVGITAHEEQEEKACQSQAKEVQTTKQQYKLHITRHNLTLALKLSSSNLFGTNHLIHQDLRCKWYC